MLNGRTGSRTYTCTNCSSIPSVFCNHLPRSGLKLLLIGKYIYFTVNSVLDVWPVFKIHAAVQRYHNIHHSGIERLRVVIPWNIDTHVTPVANHFEYVWCIDVNTRILKILNTFNALTSIPKSESVRGCRCGLQICWKFSKFGYSRQCTKCIHCFLNCRVSECQYPNFGYYDTSPAVHLAPENRVFNAYFAEEICTFLLIYFQFQKILFNYTCKKF